jgi:hypothetical protein
MGVTPHWLHSLHEEASVANGTLSQPGGQVCT